MRISFKHILFLISLLAFLGAVSAYAGIEEDLDAQLKDLQEITQAQRTPAKLTPPTPLPQDSEEELVEVTDEKEVTYEVQDSLTIGRLAKAEKPKETELTKHADSVLAFMKEELLPSLESKEDRTVATEKK